MALIGINPARPRTEKDTLDKIAQGFSIAQNVLGTALAVPEFLQKRKVGKADIKLKEAQAAKAERESQPLTPAEIQDLVDQGVPRVAIPTTRGGLAQTLRFMQTPAQKASESRATSAESRATRAETRLVEALTRTEEEKTLKKEKEESELTVEPLGQKAKTSKEARDTEKALASLATGDRIIAELIRERKASGGTAIGVKRALGKQMATQLNFIFKDIEDLGALQKPDLELLDSLIPQDPLEILQLQAFTGDTSLAKLESLKTTFRQKIIDRLKSKGFDITPQMLDAAIKSFGKGEGGVLVPEPERVFVPDAPVFDPNQPAEVID